MEPISPPLSDSPQTTSQEPIQPPPPSNRSLPQPKKNSPKILLIVIVIALLSISGVAGYMIYRNLSGQAPEQTACTLEAKVCPDGSSVGRSGPSCEFTPCPTTTPDATANWKIYTGEGFTFMYPPDWELNEDVQNTNQIAPELTKTITQGDKPAIISILKINKNNYDFDEDVNSFVPFSYKEFEHDGDLYILMASTYIMGPNITIETRNEAIKTLNDISLTFKFTDQTPITSPIPNEYMGHKVCQTDSECTSDEKCLEVGPGAIKPPVKTCWREESLPQ